MKKLLLSLTIAALLPISANAQLKGLLDKAKSAVENSTGKGSLSNADIGSGL